MPPLHRLRPARASVWRAHRAAWISFIRKSMANPLISCQIKITEAVGPVAEALAVRLVAVLEGKRLVGHCNHPAEHVLRDLQAWALLNNPPPLWRSEGRAWGSRGGGSTFQIILDGDRRSGLGISTDSTLLNAQEANVRPRFREKLTD